MMHGEIVRDDNGEPVVGEWEPICTPDEWQAVSARLEVRRGRNIDHNGNPTTPLPPAHDTHRYLLSGIARCGKPKADGTVCHAPLRARNQKDCNGVTYVCPPQLNGGCSGVGRNALRLDAFVTEAVLIRAENLDLERTSAAEWGREDELSAVVARRDTMTREWSAGNVSDEVYFSALPALEQTIRSLRADRDRYTARRAADAVIPLDIRGEWDRRDLSWRRSFIQRFVHSIEVKPMPVRGTRWTDDSVVIHWRED
jgi:hypothetical protein